MKLAVACDHAGFPLKRDAIAAIMAEGHEPVDLGTSSIEAVDYPDFARLIGEALGDGRAELLCGSGVGASVAANKLRGIRAAVCHDVYSAHQGVEHDDMNVLTLGARVIGPAILTELMVAFLRARFSGEPRHARRLPKVLQLEAELAEPRRGGP